MPYDDGKPGPGKSAEIDAIAHAAAAQLQTTGQQAGSVSTNMDPNHDPNEKPQGNPR